MRQIAAVKQAAVSGLSPRERLEAYAKAAYGAESEALPFKREDYAVLRRRPDDSCAATKAKTKNRKVPLVKRNLK